MNIRLSDHFTYRKLFRFTLPSIAMMIFSSVYGVVDGFFVSNFAGKSAFAAVNFIIPYLMILGAIGFMLGTGGSALVAKTMGEGDGERANRLFSMIILAGVVLSALFGALFFVFLRPIAVWMGAEGEMLELCVLYGQINLAALPIWVLQFEFQSFFSAAEKPQLGFYITVAAGVTNMVLDAVVVGIFRMGVAGAAIATVCSQAVGGLLPLAYFLGKNNSRLRLSKPVFDLRALWKTCTNGSSEFFSNISMSLVGILYNVQLLQYSGENGVSAYGVLMYVSMIFAAIFIGYSMGVAPVVSFHYGANDPEELHSILAKSTRIILASSVVMFLFSEAMARPLSLLFVGYDRELLNLTVRGFLIFSFCFLFCGVPIFGSSFFTALNNGPVSALISVLRTVVFQVGAVLLFPLLWGIDGIWISISAADAFSALTAVVFLLAFRKKYRY